MSVNGVTNLVKMKARDKYQLGWRNWTVNMGLAEASDKAVSPFHRADDIEVPILLMSSVDDARVPYKMSRDLHRKLGKLNKHSEYVKISDGTHYMLSTASRLSMLAETERFLAEHIGK